MNSPPHKGLTNPLKALREKQGISMYELSRRTGLSKHAILKAEQGTYTNPPEALIDYFDAPRPQLLRLYEDFQIQTREFNSRLLGNFIPDLDACPVGTHPLAYLRSNYGINPTELSKKLCIPQSVIVYFEKRSINQHTVPAQLVLALQDADYTEQETDALSEAYTRYRDWLKASKNLKLVSSNERPA